MRPDGAVLLADIGGTHARFALRGPDGVGVATVLRCAEHDGPVSAARVFLAGQAVRPCRGAFAVAGLADGDLIDVDNSHWRFSLAETCDALGLDGLVAVNDFAATALAVPHLAAGDSMALGGGAAVPGAPVAVLGPGTGLGVSALVSDGQGGWVALATEGGQVSLAPADDREAALLAILRRDDPHVAAERVLCGPGLVALYRAVAALRGRPAEEATPDAVSRRALDGSCALCAETLELFFLLLGTVAANLALSTGALGGVFLAGGILPRLAAALRESGFRARFEDHGRFRTWLGAVPTALILHPHPAFVGLATLGR